MLVAAHLVELVNRLGLVLAVHIAFVGSNCSGCQPVRNPGSTREAAEHPFQHRSEAARVGPSTNATVTGDAGPAITVKHVSTYGLKPPGKDLRLDVTLRNERSTGQWFLLPHAMKQDNWLRPVERLERTRLHGKRGVLLIGRSYLDFSAVFIPPGGVVTIRNLHTDSFVKALPAAISYEVVIAPQVFLGAEPLEAWFGQDPTAAPNVDVEDDRWQIGQDDLKDRESPTGEAVPVRVVDDRRVTLRVPLNRTPDEVADAERQVAPRAPRAVTFLHRNCRIAAPCPAARNWCSYTDCGETHLLMEFDHPDQGQTTLPELNHARLPMARCLSGVTISADESSREWTIHVRVQPTGGVEVGEVTAAHWVEGSRSDTPYEPSRRECFEKVLRAIRLKKVPAAGAAFDWLLSVSRTEGND
jgi:hypothetical protein